MLLTGEGIHNYYLVSESVAELDCGTVIVTAAK